MANEHSSWTAFLCDNFSSHCNVRALDMYLNEDSYDCTFEVENADPDEKKVNILEKVSALYQLCL